MDHELTDEEERAIAALQRVARRWPQSLTLVSMGGSLSVIRTDDERFDSSSTAERGEAVVVDIYGIPNDGGDW